MRKPISVDLRERIVATYAEGTGRGKRWRTGTKCRKLLQQHRTTGDLRPKYRFCGRKAKLMPEHSHWYPTTLIFSVRLDGTGTCLTIEDAHRHRGLPEYVREV